MASLSQIDLQNLQALSDSLTGAAFDRDLPAQRVIAIARGPAHGVFYTRDAIEKRIKNGAARPRSNSHQGAESYLILASLNSTCLRATGSYFFLTSLSVMVR